jgi:hypothetical protein
MERTEQMAADIAEKLNGGEWKDGKWYSKGHREAWINAVKPYANEIERLRETLLIIIGLDVEEFDLSEAIILARAALKGDE